MPGVLLGEVARRQLSALVYPEVDHVPSSNHLASSGGLSVQAQGVHDLFDDGYVSAGVDVDGGNDGFDGGRAGLGRVSVPLGWVRVDERGETCCGAPFGEIAV